MSQPPVRPQTVGPVAVAVYAEPGLSTRSTAMQPFPPHPPSLTTTAVVHFVDRSNTGI